jgi:hypothetical protein
MQRPGVILKTFLSNKSPLSKKSVYNAFELNENQLGALHPSPFKRKISAQSVPKPKLGAYVNLSAYYLVGIPAVLCFALVYHLGGVVFILLPLSY